MASSCPENKTLFKIETSLTDGNHNTWLSSHWVQPDSSPIWCTSKQMLYIKFQQAEGKSKKNGFKVYSQ